MKEFLKVLLGSIVSGIVVIAIIIGYISVRAAKMTDEALAAALRLEQPKDDRNEN